MNSSGNLRFLIASFLFFFKTLNRKEEATLHHSLAIRMFAGGNQDSVFPLTIITECSVDKGCDSLESFSTRASQGGLPVHRSCESPET